MKHIVVESLTPPCWKKEKEELMLCATQGEMKKNCWGLELKVEMHLINDSLGFIELILSNDKSQWPLFRSGDAE